MMEDSKIAHKTLPFIQLFLHDHPCMYGNHQNRNVSNARIHEMDPMSPHFGETRDEIFFHPPYIDFLKISSRKTIFNS